jgi:hypothetical protein
MSIIGRAWGGRCRAAVTLGVAPIVIVLMTLVAQGASCGGGAGVGGVGGSSSGSTSSATGTGGGHCSQEGKCSSAADCCSHNCYHGSCLPGPSPCPGVDVPLSYIDASMVDSGTTKGIGQYSSYCGGGPQSSGPETVYHVIIGDAGGTLFGQLKADFEGVLYVESQCGTLATTLTCVAASDAGAPSFVLPVTGGETLFVFVDGANNGAGNYALSLSLLAGSCGDGVVNTAGCASACDGGSGCAPVPGQCEQCDYGAVMELGCDASSCGFAAPPDDPAYGSDTCPGTALTIMPGTTTITIDGGTTVGYHEDYPAPCNSGGVPVGGPDRVYQISPAVNGTLTIKAQPIDFDVVLWVYQECDKTMPTKVAGLLACSDGNTKLATEQVVIPVTGGTVKPYYIVVGGYDVKSSGEFNLSVQLDPLDAGGP